MMAKSPGLEVQGLIDALDLTHPQQIDLEAIAHNCHLKIRYSPLDGCAANILGIGDRGIITIDEASSTGRQRFSLAHEIGHWIYDRGRGMNVCKTTDMGTTWTGKKRFNPIERRANVFAAELLLPRKWFIDAASGQPVSFETVEKLGRVFQSSRTATALRLVELGDSPSMLLFFDQSRSLKRFSVSKDLVDQLYPHKLLSKTTHAWKELIDNGYTSAKSEQVDGDEWINHPKAFDITLNESAIRVGTDILVLLECLNEDVVLNIIDRID